jgi:hypothetical protein
LEILYGVKERKNTGVENIFDNAVGEHGSGREMAVVESAASIPNFETKVI